MNHIDIDLSTSKEEHMTIHSDSKKNYEFVLVNHPLPFIKIKTVLLSLFLFVGGLFFTMFSLLDMILESGDKQRGLALIIVGILMLIPGSYYSYFLARYAMAKSVEEKM